MPFESTAICGWVPATNSLSHVNGNACLLAVVVAINTEKE